MPGLIIIRNTVPGSPAFSILSYIRFFKIRIKIEKFQRQRRPYLSNIGNTIVFSEKGSRKNNVVTLERQPLYLLSIKHKGMDQVFS
jgi:hypothetical protein